MPAASSANDARVPVLEASAPEPATRASNSNDPGAGRHGTRAVSSQELEQMWRTLDLNDRDDVRVAALFILLREGLRKSEIVGLNRGDLTLEVQTLRLRVRGTRQNGREARVVSFEDPTQSAILRNYLAFEHRETEYFDAPLFWTLGRHGTCRRVRITSHALSYWVTQLQRRAEISRRLSPHAFRRAWLAEGISRAEPPP